MQANLLPSRTIVPDIDVYRPETSVSGSKALPSGLAVAADQLRYTCTQAFAWAAMQ